MKPTRPTLAKVRWLLRNAAFREKPIQTLGRIVGWEIHRLTGTPTEAEFDGDLHVILQPRDGVGRILYCFGSYEAPNMRFLERVISRGMTIVDGGANIGLYTLFASKRVGPEGRVYAFEPSRDCYSRLLLNVSSNGLKNVVAENMALSRTEGMLEIVEHSDTSRTYVASTRTQSTPTQIVHANSLDKYFRINGLSKLDVLKIDVEGYELEVLEGARETIADLRPCIIQIELYEGFQNRYGSKVDHILGLLESIGYKVLQLAEGYSLRDFNRDVVPSGDAFAVREEDVGGWKRKGTIQ